MFCNLAIYSITNLLTHPGIHYQALNRQHKQPVKSALALPLMHSGIKSGARNAGYCKMHLINTKNNLSRFHQNGLYFSLLS